MKELNTHDNDSRIDESKLNHKQRRFVREYLKDKNATQAAIRAGYSIDSAHSQGSDNLRHPIMSRVINEMISEQVRKLDMKAEEIVRDVLALATYDAEDAYNEQGQLLSVPDMPASLRKAIVSFDVYEEYDKKTGELTGYTKKVKFIDKLKAIETIGKHLGLFVQEVKHSGKVTFEEIIEQTKAKQTKAK